MIKNTAETREYLLSEGFSDQTINSIKNLLVGLSTWFCQAQIPNGRDHYFKGRKFIKVTKLENGKYSIEKEER